jgi:hypothetical protein
MFVSIINIDYFVTTGRGGSFDLEALISCKCL